MVNNGSYEDLFRSIKINGRIKWEVLCTENRPDTVAIQNSPTDPREGTKTELTTENQQRARSFQALASIFNAMNVTSPHKKPRRTKLGFRRNSSLLNTTKINLLPPTQLKSCKNNKPGPQPRRWNNGFEEITYWWRRQRRPVIVRRNIGSINYRPGVAMYPTRDSKRRSLLQIFRWRRRIRRRGCVVVYAQIRIIYARNRVITNREVIPQHDDERAERCS